MKPIYRITFFLFSFFSFITSSLSQNKVIDSLENELVINKQKDTIRVNNLDRLAFLYYRKDISKATEYVEKAESLADELNFQKGKGNAIYMRGNIQIVQSNFDLAIEHFKNAVQIYSANGIKKNMAGCYNSMGAIHYYRSNYEQALINFKKALQIDKEVGIKRNIPSYITNIGNINVKIGDYPEALEYFNKGLNLYKENENKVGISASLRKIAVVYKTQGNYPLALDYHNRSLVLAEEIQDSTGIAISLSSMGHLYKQQKKYDKSLELFKRTLVFQEKVKNKKDIAGAKNSIASIYIKKEEYSTAIEFLKESLEINREIKAKSQIAECLNNLGKVQVLQEKYTNAFTYFEEAKSINTEIGNQEGLSYSYLGTADSYVQLKNYDNALINLLKSLEISNKLGLIEHQRDVHKLLSEVYKHKNQYQKAFSNHQQFKILNDSLFNKENIEKITQLEYEYKYKKALDSASLRELKLTKTVLSTSQDLEKSQRNLLLGVIAFLTVALLMGAVIFFLKLRHEKSKTQNIVIEQKLLRSQMTPHFIFNSLSVLQGMILNKEDNNAISYLSKFSKLLRTILENSRHKTVVLSEELSAIEDYMALQNLDVNPPYEYSLTVASDIDKSAFKIPPMLIQPFIENAIEHAFSNKKENKEINVALIYKDEKLVCTIKDSGIGINMDNQNNQKSKKSLATKITSERLEMLSKDFNVPGSVSVKNRKTLGEQGTLVTLVIPYKMD